MDEITEEQAIEIYKSEVWKTWRPEQIVKFQLFTDRLCIPFSIFQEAITKVLNRPVWSHEFMDIVSLQKEYLGEKSAPSFKEILELIPEEKRVLILKS